MRTNIEINDKLMKDTLKVTGLKTKREVVDRALKELLKLERQKDFRKLKGKIAWQGDLDQMRLDR